MTTADRRRLAHALPSLRDADARAISSFIEAAWAEHGLARQTQDAYRRDLEQLARWRDGAGGGLQGIDRAGLFDYLRWRTGHGYQPRSNARLRASLRAFYAWLVRSGARADDPAALIEPPRLPRPLPGSTPTGSARMGCATASPPTCSTAVPTCVRCRCCSAMPRCPPPRSTPWWRASTSSPCTPATTRGPDRRCMRECREPRGRRPV